MRKLKNFIRCHTRFSIDTRLSALVSYIHSSRSCQVCLDAIFFVCYYANLTWEILNYSIILWGNFSELTSLRSLYSKKNFIRFTSRSNPLYAMGLLRGRYSEVSLCELIMNLLLYLEFSSSCIVPKYHEVWWWLKVIFGEIALSSNANEIRWCKWNYYCVVFINTKWKYSF